MKEKFTYEKLVDYLIKKGNNLAEIAIGDMMEIVENETGTFPNWNDIVPDWILKNCFN